MGYVLGFGMVDGGGSMDVGVIPTGWVCGRVGDVSNT